MSLHVHKNFLPSLAFILFACENMILYTLTGFLGLKFSTAHFINSRVFLARGHSIYFFLQGLILNRLAMTKRAWIWWPWNWGKKVIYTHTYIHTCIQTYMYPKLSNGAGIGHRQDRLFMYATWISLGFAAIKYEPYILAFKLKLLLVIISIVQMSVSLYCQENAFIFTN